MAFLEQAPASTGGDVSGVAADQAVGRGDSLGASWVTSTALNVWLQ